MAAPERGHAGPTDVAFSCAMHQYDRSDLALRRIMAALGAATAECSPGRPMGGRD